MNFLAHAYLSFDQDEILIGNFIGDFVRGKMVDTFSIGIRQGIWLHREIDKFTDSHPLVKAGQSYLRPTFGHYSTVITDIFFDYFLGKYWDKYSQKTLEQFAEETYQTISKYEKNLPEEFKAMFFWMRSQNWLLNYRTFEGIQRSLTGLSKRARFDSKMEVATQFLVEKEKEFESIFFAFFEDLETFAQEKLIEIQLADAGH